MDQVVIKPFYYGASNFNNGLAWVKFYSVDQKAYKCGFINKKGEIVINPVYDQVSNFEGNYIVVKLGNKYGVIDTKRKNG